MIKNESTRILLAIMKNYLLLFTVPLVLVACSNQEKAPGAPIAVSEGYLTINGSEVYYKTMGSGAPIVIIHGGPVMDHSYFLPHMETLAQDYQLIFYDQRACGRSSLEVDQSKMSLAGFVEDIELLRQELDLGDIHLLGHSWGGLPAMKYAIRYPEHLQSLMLSNSLPASTGHWQKEQELTARRLTKQDSLDRLAIANSEEMRTNPAAAVEKILRLSFESQFHNPALLDELSLYVPEDYMARSQIFQRLGPDLASFNLYDDLQKLEKPVLILYGDQEPAADISGKSLEETIPDARLVILNKCGHFPFVEQPEAYFGAIRAFLKKIR